VSCETVFCPLFLQEISKFVAEKFTSTVRVESFDVGAMLSFCPCHIHLVSSKSLVLGLQQVQMHILSVFVQKSHIIFATANGCHR
jgi:hypothetical protein